jgi:hypothetical protein
MAMIDGYTKVVLTLIATALSAIAIHQYLEPAQSQGAGCGAMDGVPCRIVQVCYKVTDPQHPENGFWVPCGPKAD